MIETCVDTSGHVAWSPIVPSALTRQQSGVLPGARATRLTPGIIIIRHCPAGADLGQTLSFGDVTSRVLYDQSLVLYVGA